MAEPYQPINVNTGSAQQAIQSTPNVTPSLDGLMNSIKEGFISADDIRKRVSSGPLEAATRAQDTADVTQVRPLQRQAAVAELQNVQAKQEFEASQLPILNEVKRATLQQAFNNAQQFGVPEEVLKVFYASVPGFIPFDPDKLHDKKTGQVNLPYAIEMTQKAHLAAQKIAEGKNAKPVTITNVSPEGVKTTQEQYFTTLGAPIGAPIPTGVQNPNVAEAEAKATAAKAGLSNDVLQERQRSDIIKRYVPQLGAFDAIDTIRTRKEPPKNADDLAILYEFVKVLDPTSVVREGEKKFAESTAPGVQQWYNQVQGLWSDSNKTMDVTTRNNLYRTVDTLRQGAEKTVLPELKRLSNLAIDRGMPLSQALTEPELKLLVNGSGAPKAEGNLGDLSIEQLKEVSINGTAAPVAAPVITTTNETDAATQANALSPTVQFFKWNGDTYKNPNYKP